MDYSDRVYNHTNFNIQLTYKETAYRQLAEPEKGSMRSLDIGYSIQHLEPIPLII